MGHTPVSSGFALRTGVTGRYRNLALLTFISFCVLCVLCGELSSCLRGCAFGRDPYVALLSYEGQATLPYLGLRCYPLTLYLDVPPRRDELGACHALAWLDVGCWMLSSGFPYPPPLIWQRDLTFRFLRKICVAPSLFSSVPPWFIFLLCVSLWTLCEISHLILAGFWLEYGGGW